jgi:putative transposase
VDLPESDAGQTAPDIRNLINRLAKENPRWGYLRIRGEPKKLGIFVAASTIRAILLKEGLGPAPRRIGPTWRAFIRAQAQGIVACDFFTVETAWLRTIYVFFFIHVGSRRILLARSTTAPNSYWVVQQARNLILEQPNERRIDFMLRDRDSKYSAGFDEIFRTGALRSSKHRFGRRTRTPTPSDVSERSARNVSTTF